MTLSYAETRATLIAAGIPAARMPEKWRSGIDLSRVDLSRVDLSGANLTEAYLTDADLSEADLSEANLREAYLRRVNLTGADLTGANLSGANLTEAYLREANLRRVNLTGASGPFTTFAAGRHSAVFAGGHGVIGCVRRTYDDWLRDYAAIGAANGYTAEEIEEYGQFIALAVARQRRTESAPDAGGGEG